MAFGDFRDFTRRTASDKISRDKAFNIAKNLKYSGYQLGLASMVFKLFDKKSSGSCIKYENMSDQQLVEEFHKPVITKLNKRKVQPPFIDNIWGADIDNMQLISKFNKGIRFLLCVIDISSKYAWVIPLKDKKGITITNAFQKILKESSRKSNKIWVQKGSELYHRSMKSWLEKNAIGIYSTDNEGKSLVAKRFIRTLKNKIYKHMTSISENIYIDKLDDMVNKYNNAYPSTIRMKLFDVKSNTYIDSSKKIMMKILNLKLMILLEHQNIKNIFAKDYVPNWSKEILSLKKLKTLCHGHTLL